MLLGGRIKGVAFDLNGTLVDSADIVLEAWRRTFEANGYRVEKAALDQLIGASPAKIIREVAGNVNDQVFEELEEDFNSNLESQIHLIKPFPEAVDALNRLVREGIKIAVASTSNTKVVNAVLAKSGLLRFVDAAVGGNEVLLNKPDPQIYSEAFKRIGVAPAMGAVVGDSDYDAIPAKKLGALAIIVSRRNTRIQHADLVFSSLLEAVTEILDA